MSAQEYKGSVKSNALVLQGYGANSTEGHDVTMKVMDDEFTMMMGEDILMTVGRDEDPVSGAAIVTESNVDKYATNKTTHLEFAKDVKMKGELVVDGGIKLRNVRMPTWHMKVGDYVQGKPRFVLEVEKEDAEKPFIAMFSVYLPDYSGSTSLDFWSKSQTKVSVDIVEKSLLSNYSNTTDLNGLALMWVARVNSGRFRNVKSIKKLAYIKDGVEYPIKGPVWA